jgi:hypothetical protein
LKGYQGAEDVAKWFFWKDTEIQLNRQELKYIQQDNLIEWFFIHSHWIIGLDGLFITCRILRQSTIQTANQKLWILFIELWVILGFLLNLAKI